MGSRYLKDAKSGTKGARQWRILSGADRKRREIPDRVVTRVTARGTSLGETSRRDAYRGRSLELGEARPGACSARRPPGPGVDPIIANLGVSRRRGERPMASD